MRLPTICRALNALDESENECAPTAWSPIEQIAFVLHAIVQKHYSIILFCGYIDC
jgi:hypothetical protein